VDAIQWPLWSLKYCQPIAKMRCRNSGELRWLTPQFQQV